MLSGASIKESDELSIPKDNVERAILIMFNLAMAGQIDDDWYGREVDARLGIPSFAMATIGESGKDIRGVRKKLKIMRDRYKQNAKELGMAPIGAWLAIGGQEVGQWRMHKQMRKFRRERERNPKAPYLAAIPIIPFSPDVVLPPRDAAFANNEI